MGSQVPEFGLKWNNHRSVMVSVLDALLEREKLVDVTLAAEGQFLNVHLLVLFAFIRLYFISNLPSQKPDKPAIIFPNKNVRFNDLKALVAHVFKGAVNVSEDQLAAVLETTEALKFKGLVEKQDNSNVSRSEHQVPHQQPEQQKVLTVKSTSQQNVTSAKKTPIPGYVKCIKQTPAAPPHTKSMAIEQPKDIQDPTLPLEQDMMEEDENLIALATKQDGEMIEFLLEDDQFEATEEGTQLAG